MNIQPCRLPSLMLPTLVPHIYYTQHVMKASFEDIRSLKSIKKLQRLKRNSWFCYVPEWCFRGTPPKSPSEKENQTKTAKQEGFFHSRVPCSTSSSCTGNLDTASGHDCEAVNDWQNKSLDVAAVTGQVALVFMSFQITSQLFVGAFLLFLKCPVLFRMTCRFIHTGKFIKVCAEVFQFSCLNENNSE